MATIATRVADDGSTSFRVKVRFKRIPTADVDADDLLPTLGVRPGRKPRPPFASRHLGGTTEAKRHTVAEQSSGYAERFCRRKTEDRARPVEAAGVVEPAARRIFALSGHPLQPSPATNHVTCF